MTSTIKKKHIHQGLTDVSAGQYYQPILSHHICISIGISFISMRRHLTVFKPGKEMRGLVI